MVLYVIDRAILLICRTLPLGLLDSWTVRLNIVIALRLGLSLGHAGQCRELKESVHREGRTVNSDNLTSERGDEDVEIMVAKSQM